MLFLPLENKTHIFVQSNQLLDIWEAGQERRLADQKKKTHGWYDVNILLSLLLNKTFDNGLTLSVDFIYRIMD